MFHIEKCKEYEENTVKFTYVNVSNGCNNNKKWQDPNVAVDLLKQNSKKQNTQSN